MRIAHIEHVEWHFANELRYDGGINEIFNPRLNIYAVEYPRSHVTLNI